MEINSQLWFRTKYLTFWKPFILVSAINPNLDLLLEINQLKKVLTCLSHQKGQSPDFPKSFSRNHFLIGVPNIKWASISISICLNCWDLLAYLKPDLTWFNANHLLVHYFSPKHFRGPPLAMGVSSRRINWLLMLWKYLLQLKVTSLKVKTMGFFLCIVLPFRFTYGRIKGQKLKMK